MGLDMYLSKRNYVKNWDHQADKFQVLVKKNGEELPKEIIDPAKVTYVEQEVGYWRKANAIHSWFIQNCADGNDDCRDVDVSVEDLQNLLELVNQVVKESKLVDGKIQNGSRGTANGWEPIMEDGKYIANPELAGELLPTTSGFFFGSTDYDEYYFQDLVATKEILEEALKDPEGEFQYRASW